ncbi:MAG: PorV/PorQ family protein [Gemmatimonadetes bacterium]|nr:PorV/PorQ family protein [Gemmatimonadota bacterium]
MSVWRGVPTAFVALAATLAPAALWAAQAGPGTTGAAVLALPGGTRPAALGDAYAALGDDEIAVFYNPAGLASAPALAVNVSYEVYFLDIGLAAAAAACALGPGRAGIGLRYADYGEITELVPDAAFGGQRGRATGQTLSASDLAFTGGYGLPLWRGRLAIGASTTLVHVQLAETSSSSVAADVGLQARAAGDRVTAAVAIQHLGSSPAPGERVAVLPRTVRVALAVRQPLGPASVRATAEAVARRDAGAVAAGAIEVELPAGAPPATPAVVLRGGFRRGGEETVRRPLSAGAAVRVFGTSVEYAYRAFDLLGATHRLGIRWARR